MTNSEELEDIKPPSLEELERLLDERQRAAALEECVFDDVREEVSADIKKLAQDVEIEKARLEMEGLIRREVPESGARTAYINKLKAELNNMETVLGFCAEPDEDIESRAKDLKAEIDGLNALGDDQLTPPPSNMPLD